VSIRFQADNDLNTSFGDPNFGRIFQAYPSRSIQLGLKLYW